MPSSSETYRIDLTPAAARALRKLTAETRRRIARRIDALATQPRPADAARIEGAGGLYRVRVGDHRIVYSILDDVLLVLVVRIGHRSEIYKAMRRR